MRQSSLSATDLIKAIPEQVLPNLGLKFVKSPFPHAARVSYPVETCHSPLLSNEPRQNTAGASVEGGWH